MNDKTITIYNYHKNADKIESWQRTVITGVSIVWGIDKAVTSSGVVTRSQSLSVVIPENADTSGREYVDYTTYLKLEDTSKNWTINPSCNKEIIVCGACDSEISATYKLTNLKVDNAKSGIVSALADNTDMPLLRHFKVVCK